MPTEDDNSHRDGDERMSSRDMAVLVVDALFRSKIVRQEDLQKAIEIAAEEIEVRKVMGDY